MTDSDHISEIEQNPPAPRLKLKPGFSPEHRTMSKALSRRRVAGATGRRREPVLPEWHRLTPSQRAGEWAELVDWVSWLHGRYELDIEERLPHCWAEHPGLVEELRALRTWRIEIYTSPDPQGQAARYWHAELRQTIHAANAFYASGCRAGHYGSTAPAHQNKDLQKRWQSADHTAGVSPALLDQPTTAPSKDAAISSNAHLYLAEVSMAAHRDSGTAVPLSATVTEFLHYDASWWTSHKGGWLRVTDPELSQRLDERSSRLRRADQSLTRLIARKAAGQKQEAP